jgi:hypothetical protein
VDVNETWADDRAIGSYFTPAGAGNGTNLGDLPRIDGEIRRA